MIFIQFILTKIFKCVYARLLKNMTPEERVAHKFKQLAESIKHCK